MKFFKKFLEYSKFTTGDFEAIFANMTVPPCPRVVMTLMKKLSEPDIEIDHIIPILESDPSLALQILKVANSALYGLPMKVTTISRAVSLLGLKEIQNIALGYAMSKALKDPRRKEFDYRKYWKDTIMRAIFSKELAKILAIEAEEAFSASLLQDIAIPMLMAKWYHLYAPVYGKWLKGEDLLNNIEDEVLSWNHAQAGAWIAKKWELPDIFTCCIGLHNTTIEEIRELGLEDTSVIPVAVSSRLSAFPDPEQSFELTLKETVKLGIGEERLKNLLAHCLEVLEDIASTLVP